MNIFIVEDSEAKLESIRGILANLIPSASFDVAYSVQSAIECLRNNLPDLIVADMSLPTYDIERYERGGSPRPFGGVEVFEHLDRYDCEVPIIVVTSYPTLGDGDNALNLKQLSERLRNDFPVNFFGAVYFDSVYSNWESEFSALINNIQSGK